MLWLMALVTCSAAVAFCSEGAQCVRRGDGAAIVICSRVMSCHVMSCRVMLVTSRRVASRRAVSCGVVPRHAREERGRSTSYERIAEIYAAHPHKRHTDTTHAHTTQTYSTHFHTTHSLTTHLMRSRSVVLRPRLPSFRLPIHVFHLNFTCGVIRSNFFFFLFNIFIV